MRVPVAVAAVAVAAVLVLAGCSGDDAPGARPSDVDVDTPELRAMKAEAGIVECVPGTGSSDLPDLTLPCLGGGPDVDLSALEGPVVLNLWYSACRPCRDEMPVLQEFHEQYADQVPIIGVDVETYPDAAIDFADAVGVTYPQLADPGGTIFDDPGLALAQAFPQTIVVDADGAVTKHAGEVASLDELLSVLRDGGVEVTP